MKHVILLVSALSMASPLSAQETSERSLDQGLALLEEGTQLLLKGLMEEMEPALEGMRDALSNLDVYYPPEILPNGDVIIRRKVPLEPEPPAGEIDL
ncbi:MAG: hypothetical protein AAFN59_08110 [Pseudomonadota bacterium]